jgi:hypothetical protein
MPNFRPFIIELRKQGFEKTSDSRAGGCRCAIFTKRVGERLLDLQLWGDGKHRVSHWICASMNTQPTDFTDLAGMREAITRETVRTDNKYLKQA